jgi:hypothetical protein
MVLSGTVRYKGTQIDIGGPPVTNGRELYLTFSTVLAWLHDRECMSVSRGLLAWLHN